MCRDVRLVAFARITITALHCRAAMKSAVSAASVGAGVVPELQEERARASFSVEEMTHFLHGGRAAYHRAAFLDALLEVDHTFSKRDELFMPRTELYARGAARVARVQQLARMFSLSDAEQASMRLMMDTQTPTELHYSMFIPALMGMCTPEQQVRAVPRVFAARACASNAVRRPSGCPWPANCALSARTRRRNWGTAPSSAGLRPRRPTTRPRRSL